MTPAPTETTGSGAGRPCGAARRVLFVAHDAGMFGAQRVLLTLLQGIDRALFECHVVVPEDGPFIAEVGKLGHAVHIRRMVRWVPAVQRIEKAGLFRYLVRCLGGLRPRAWAIAELIRRHRIDVVYTNTVTCLEGAVAARMAGVPHVWYVTEPIFDNPELRGIAPALVYRAAIGALSSQLVFCSRSLAADYAGLEKRSRVVYPGLPLPAPSDRAAARSQLLARLGLPASARFVGVVAALQPRKDHATFLAAARRVRDRRPDAFFLIVGKGNPGYTAEVEARLQSLGLADCARLMGWWEGEIHDLIAGLDLLVISSIQESFGLTAVEALAVETPVVSTLCGGPSEVVREGIDGRLVPVGDAQAMADAIEAMLAGSAAAAAMARTGRQRVTQTFTEERFVTSVTEIIECASPTRGIAEVPPVPSGP